MTLLEASNIASDPVVSIEDFVLRLPHERSDVAIIRGVSLDVMPGEILGLVGESGSGKSLTARSIFKLLPKGARVDGAIRFEGRNTLELPEADLRRIRGGRAGMIFQDPMAAFNPVMRIGAQIGEAIQAHEPMAKPALRARVASLLSRVGIPNAEARMDSYPHEFSGGMRQRAMIAMAIANSPSLIVADEPTAALDVTVQDQILDLLRGLNETSGTAILLITHNFAVVASLCQRVAVMYAGQIVEEGPVESVLGSPQHPYTWSLLQSVPRLESPRVRLPTVDGQPPDPAAMPAGCAFEPRCCFSVDRCRQEPPSLKEVGPGRHARCWVLMRNAEALAR